MRLLVLTSDDLAHRLPDKLPEAEIHTALDAADSVAVVVADVERAGDLEEAGLPTETPVVWCANAGMSGVDLWALTGLRRSRVAYRPTDPNQVAGAIRELIDRASEAGVWGDDADAAGPGRAARPSVAESDPAAAPTEQPDADPARAEAAGAAGPSPEEPWGDELDWTGVAPGLPKSAGTVPPGLPKSAGTVPLEPEPDPVSSPPPLERAHRVVQEAGLENDLDGFESEYSRPEAPAPGSGRRGGPLDELWLRFRDTMLERLGQVEMVAAALLDDAADPVDVRAAHEVAHKLHGSLGTFGVDRGSRLAAELESLLEPVTEAGRAESTDVLRIMELAVEIRQEVEARRSVAGAAEEERVDADGGARPLVLLVEPDQASAHALAAAAMGQGLEPAVVDSLEQAMARFGDTRPAAVVIDLEAAPAEALKMVMKEASLGVPRVPVLVHSRSTSMAVRAEAARYGVQRFLAWPAPPDTVMEHVTRMVEGRSREQTVLVVDDDQDMLERIAADLRQAGFRVRALAHAPEFWHALEAVRPDLVVLAMDLPEVSGAQLCRMLRADPAWADLPVVCLTRELDLDSYRRGYRAGADDFITAPFQAGELAARIAHRLDRTARRMGLRDPETGLPTAALFRSMLEQLVAMADRSGEPVSVVRARVRRPRQLGPLALELKDQLRPPDLLGVWGADELAVARWGGSEDARWLDDWVRQDGEIVAYAGLASFPELQTTEALLDTAGRRLRHAIEQGPRPSG